MEVVILKALKVFRFIMILVVMLSVLLLSSVSASAYANNIDYSIGMDKLAEKPENWIQGSIPNVNKETISGTDSTSSIASSACSSFAMTYALVKMGIYNPTNGDNPYSLIKVLREKNLIFPGAEWGYFDFTRVNEVDKSVHYEWRDDTVKGMNFDQAIKDIKGLWNEGYYVVAIVYGGPTRGHCIFMDGINEDGSISIGDSGFVGTTWEETYGKYDMRFSYLEVMSCDGKPFLNQPSIYDDNILRAVSDKEVEDYNVLLYEKDVEDMRVRSHNIAKIELQSLSFNPYPEVPGRGIIDAENIKDCSNDIKKNNFLDMLVFSILTGVMFILLIVYCKKYTYGRRL